MIWAILDSSNKVTSIVTQEERPTNGVKGHDPSCSVGKIFNGWTFDFPEWTAFQFLMRFTAQEREAIRSASKADSTLADFLQLSQAAQTISAGNQMTIDGMNYLVTSGIITEQRKQEILDVNI